MIYTVIAYRWGWLNNHQYSVAATQDEDRASSLASEECDSRGGKYGVAVYEWSDDETCRMVEYYPSSYGEERPFENHRLTMFSSVGHSAHEVATTGVAWAAPKGESAMQPKAVAIPRWLREAVERHETTNRFMDAVWGDIRERQAAGTGERTPEEQKRWTDATLRGIERDVRRMLREAPAKRRGTMAARQQRQAIQGAAAVPAGDPAEPGEATPAAGAATD